MRLKLSILILVLGLAMTSASISEVMNIVETNTGGDSLSGLVFLFFIGSILESVGIIMIIYYTIRAVQNRKRRAAVQA